MRVFPPAACFAVNFAMIFAAIFAAIFATLPLGSCRSDAAGMTAGPPVAPDAAQRTAAYTITDYKNKAGGGAIPGWVRFWLDSAERGVENLDAYRDRYAFVARNEANNFNALNLWKDGFSAELDFPRLAAARIEARFSSAVPNPDASYGAFFEALIRAASDFPWTGAVRVDDFWILRRFDPDEGPSGYAGEDSITESVASDGSIASGGSVRETENWEMLILVTIERFIFESQLDRVFQSVNPEPPPSRDQRAVINRVKDRFFDGF